MLSCQDCERYLYAFLDHALDIKESLDVQEHMRSCTACVTRLDAERTLRSFLHKHGRVPPLPEELKRRIVRQAMHLPAGQHWWVRMGVIRHVRDFVMGVAAAAALLLAVGYFLNASSGDDITQKFVQEASTTYGTYKTQHMPPEVESPDDTVVTQWLNSRMGYQLKVPCITDAGAQLLGGRLCRLLDRKSAALLYKRNGIDILLFAFKGESLSLAEKHADTKDQIYIQSVGGRPVAMWQRGEITYSMVGDLPRDELRRLAETVHYR
jgi:anti-sigma factor (TIGR02949 family)